MIWLNFFKNLLFSIQVVVVILVLKNNLLFFVFLLSLFNIFTTRSTLLRHALVFELALIHLLEFSRNTSRRKFVVNWLLSHVFILSLNCQLLDIALIFNLFRFLLATTILISYKDEAINKSIHK